MDTASLITNDAKITVNIKTKFLSDPDLRTYPLRVYTHDSNVELGGCDGLNTKAHIRERDKALKIAREEDGVKSAKWDEKCSLINFSKNNLEELESYTYKIGMFFVTVASDNGIPCSYKHLPICSVGMFTFSGDYEIKIGPSLGREANRIFKKKINDETVQAIVKYTDNQQVSNLIKRHSQDAINKVNSDIDLIEKSWCIYDDICLLTKLSKSDAYYHFHDFLDSLNIIGDNPSITDSTVNEIG
jgi:hypothetical protein